MDGTEWKETRSKMNPLFLKKDSFEKYAFPWSNKVTDLLVEKWLHQLEIRGTNHEGEGPVVYQIKDLENTLHKWSVESVLSVLFGKTFFDLGNYVTYSNSSTIL